MPTNECIPYFEPAARISAICDGDVVGKTFAAVSGTPSGGLEGFENIHVDTAAAGGHAVGVFAYDEAEDEVVPLLNGPGMIIPVTAGDDITAGDPIAVGAGGTAVPATNVPASLATGTVGANNGITWTSRLPGDLGEEITVTIVDPAGNNVALSVDVDGRDIVVTGATDGASALTSTAAQVIAAIQEHDTASQLVDVANTGASSGAGVVVAVAETPLAGGVDEGVVVGLAVATVSNGEDAPVRLRI